jgi:hypothetical protein
MITIMGKKKASYTAQLLCMPLALYVAQIGSSGF